MPPAEHRAIARHSAAVLAYEQRHDAERERLNEVHQVREIPTTEEPLSGRPDMAVINAMRAVNEDLAKFDEQNKPDLFPWDTPAKIRNYMEVRHDVRSSSATLQTEISAEVMKSIVRNGYRTPEQFASEDYVHARKRILAFAEIAPSIRDDPTLAEPKEIQIGIQNLHAWCVAAEKTPKRFGWGKLYTVLVTIIAVLGVFFGTAPGQDAWDWIKTHAFHVAASRVSPQ